jgi:hypothetical protein
MASSAKHGGFQMVSINIGVSPNGWFIMKKPIKIDDEWGTPHFRKPSYDFIDKTC